MDRIRLDNGKLYEKIKFLQNYSGKKGGDRVQPSSDDMEARYSAQYEQKLDPFTHFNKTVSPLLPLTDDGQHQILQRT